MKRVRAIFAVWLILAGVIYVLHGSKAAAAMFIVAAFYCVLALIMVYVCGKKLEVAVRGESGVNKEQKAEVTVTSSNRSRIPVPACRLDVSCRNILTREQQQISLIHACGPNSEKSSSFSLTSSYCGMEDIKIDEVRISDPAGLFSRSQKADADAKIYVMPEVKEIEIPSEYLDSYDMESYSYSQHIKGTDTGEVFGIREYADGDSPKQIHWKLSAKMDDLMVKIPSYPIENKLAVLLDNSIAVGQDISADKRNDLMELFFSVSLSLLRKNITHSLGWCDHRTGGFILKRIENENDMWAAVPEALSAGIEESRLSTSYRFIGAYGEEHFTNHFIVTATGAVETELLNEYGQVREFMCR
ncbi:MAG: DUF58 domain-containing protein [Eubacterium sp.]|nr:DUF58 domain-containing protein [Eubacterium sp.]